MALSGLEHDPLPVLDALDDDLREGHVCELELALVLLLLEAHIEHVDGAAQGADSNLRAVTLPCDRGHGIVVFDLLAANLIPLWTLGVEVVDVESVEVTNDGSLSSGIESGTGELLHTLVLGIIEALEAVSSLLVEMDLSIVTASQNVGAPGKSIGNGGMLDLALSLGIDVEGQNGAIEMA